MTSFDLVIFLEIFTVYHFLLDCSPYVCFPALLTVHDSLSLHVWCIYYICETMCMCYVYQLSPPISMFFSSIRLHLFYYYRFLLILSTSFEISVLLEILD